MKPNTKLIIGVATGAVILGGAAFLLTRPSTALTGPQGPPGPPQQGCPAPGSLGVNTSATTSSTAGMVDALAYTMTSGHEYILTIDVDQGSTPTAAAVLASAGFNLNAAPNNPDPCAVTFIGTWHGSGHITAIGNGFAVRNVFDNTAQQAVLG